MTGENTTGKVPRFRAKMNAGETFVIVELLDPSDSMCFKRIMRRKGLRDLTPKVRGNTFRSRRPTEDWMKEVANLDPDWWYLSGHAAFTDYYDPKDDKKVLARGHFSFFNKPYYLNEWLTGRYESGTYGFAETNRNSWRICLAYGKDSLYESRSELKDDNFFEKYGNGSYPNAKVVLAVGCNTLVDPEVRRYFSQLFPSAVVLGHVHKNPANATPIIRNFLREYFSRLDRAHDWEHVVTSWLSYHDKAKNSIMKRAYGLAALHKGNVWGIGLDKTYPRVLAWSREREWFNVARARIVRWRLKSILRPNQLVDVLQVYDTEQRHYVMHEWKYQGDEQVIDRAQLSDDEIAPYIAAGVHLERNRGY